MVNYISKKKIVSNAVDPFPVDPFLACFGMAGFSDFLKVAHRFKVVEHRELDGNVMMNDQIFRLIAPVHELSDVTHIKVDTEEARTYWKLPVRCVRPESVYPSPVMIIPIRKP
jgi:hypothetical protein